MIPATMNRTYNPLLKQKNCIWISLRMTVKVKTRFSIEYFHLISAPQTNNRFIEIHFNEIIKKIYTYIWITLFISFMNIKRKRISVLMISTFLPESKNIHETPPNIINWYNPTKVNINKWMTIDLIESKHLITFPDTFQHIRNLGVAILSVCTLSVHIYHYFFHRWRHYECTFANR